MVKIALLAIIAASSALFTWSATRYPDVWALGCIAGAVIAGIAFGMLGWTEGNDDSQDRKDTQPWL